MSLTSNTREITDDLLNFIDNISVEDERTRFIHNSKANKDSVYNVYNQEWNDLFEIINKEKICNFGINGKLRSCRYRSVVWRVYLSVLSSNTKNWISEIEDQRKTYSKIKQRHIIDPRSTYDSNTELDNPLSLDNNSVWNQYFKCQDTMKEIKQDVVRTFPDIEFFLKSTVRQIMINILYCYTQYHDISYKQGFHEILAPILFVIHSDHLANEHICEILTTSAQLEESTLHPVTLVLMNSEYLEHDAYAIFVKIMQAVQPWYEIPIFNCTTVNNPTTESKQNLVNSFSSAKMNFFKNLKPFEKPREEFPKCVLGKKVQQIHYEILKRHDLEIHMYFEKLEISPQLFGFRWLKLLFGREFTMQDLLLIWDLVFATSIQNKNSDKDFIIVDYLYVAMIIHIRDCLLMSDYANCLTTLMNYPKDADVNRIIENALYLYKPTIYQKPIDRAFYRGLDFSKQRQYYQDRQNSIKGGVDGQISLRRRRAERNKTIVGIENFTSKFANKLFETVDIKKPSNALTSSASFHSNEYLCNQQSTQPNFSKRPISLYSNKQSIEKITSIHKAVEHSSSVSDSAPITPTNQMTSNQFSFQSQPTPEHTNDFVDINISASDSVDSSTQQDFNDPSKNYDKNIEKYHQAAYATIQLLNQSLARLKSTSPISSQNLEMGVSLINQAVEVLKVEILNKGFKNSNQVKSSENYSTLTLPFRSNKMSGNKLNSGTMLNRSVSSNDIVNLLQVRARNNSENPADISEKLLKMFSKDSRKTVEMTNITFK